SPPQRGSRVMPSKHFTDIRITHLTNEDACRANGGPWCVHYKRDGIDKSNGFHTAAVATAFATKLEAGELDGDALHAQVSPLLAANTLMRQALEIIATTDTVPAVITMLDRNALAEAGAL